MPLRRTASVAGLPPSPATRQRTGQLSPTAALRALYPGRIPVGQAFHQLVAASRHPFASLCGASATPKVENEAPATSQPSQPTSSSGSSSRAHPTPQASAPITPLAGPFGATSEIEPLDAADSALAPTEGNANSVLSDSADLAPFLGDGFRVDGSYLSFDPIQPCRSGFVSSSSSQASQHFLGLSPPQAHPRPQPGMIPYDDYKSVLSTLLKVTQHHKLAEFEAGRIAQLLDNPNVRFEDLQTGVRALESSITTDLKTSEASTEPAVAELLAGDNRADIREWLNNNRPTNTKRTYAGGWIAFEAFCRDSKYVPLPASPDTVCRYIMVMSDKGAAGSSIGVAVSAIRSMHISLAITDPTQDPLVRTIRKLAVAKAGPATGGKLALNEFELNHLAALFIAEEAVHTDGIWKRKTLRDAAMIFVAIAGCLRASEVVGLTATDVKFVVEGSVMRQSECLVLTLRKTKTNQVGTPTEVFIAGSDQWWCPVRWMRRWIEQLDADCVETLGRSPFDEQDEKFAVFCHTKELGVAIQPNTLNRRVKELCTQIGLDARKYGSHSLRKSGATLAATKGASVMELKELGRWKSDAFFAYYKPDIAERLKASLRMLQPSPAPAASATAPKPSFSSQ